MAETIAYTDEMVGAGHPTKADTLNKLTLVEHDSDGIHKVKVRNKNVIINGGFTLNQRVFVSAATLATTVFGHDRWKAGASGGDYSFTQLNSNTVITIASGKTLIQVVEDKNVVGGTYTLSWEGTAQGRYAVDSDTPAGAYADSPIAITGQTAGTTMSVEFDDGTLSKVQLESGTVETLFEYRHISEELALCLRYYEKTYNLGTAVGSSTSDGSILETAISTTILGGAPFKVTKRSAPTVTIYSKNGTINKVTYYTTGNDPAATFTPSITSVNGFLIITADSAILGLDAGYHYHYIADSEL